ncbi:MAG: ABC transporter permease [Lachnospiraceae bacterium]|nr:ABC transporter permease [Lachnospiraceae bacterium]
MSKKDVNDKNETQQYSLNDDRRVKVLSPGALVAKRFARNRMAMVGLIVLIFMFLFSFLGGIISPYGEDQLFYRNDMMSKEYASAIVNEEYRYGAFTEDFNSVIQAKMFLAISKKADTFEYNGVQYGLTEEGKEFYSASKNGEMIGIAYKDIFNASAADSNFDMNFRYAALKAYTNGEATFESEGKTYRIDLEEGHVFDGTTEAGYISRIVVQALMPDIFLSKGFKDQLIEVINDGGTKFVFTDTDGVEYEYELTYKAATKTYTILQEKESRVFDTYAQPSAAHWLGTDRNGMDMLTRLMYGGRVSLVIGFIVEIISLVLGVIMGGISGYFGGWVDMLVMRIVDVFYCIPSMPIIIILGAAMDATGVDPTIRMVYLMLILGFLGWPGMARLVRGQILSLREQEYMTATEATGLTVSRRIFKHLVPNVIPQLIVSATMGLGGTIITEATLSFLGLGVKFPFASWGNIINDVNNVYVLQNYWFIWIPAGVLLLATVLAFNLVGDGLRDAFDPRMKR